MFTYDGKIVEIDDSLLMLSLEQTGLGILKTQDLQFETDEEFALQYHYEPNKLILVTAKALQLSPENEDRSWILMRRGAFFSSQEVMGGLKKFFTDECLPEIGI